MKPLGLKRHKSLPESNRLYPSFLTVAVCSHLCGRNRGFLQLDVGPQRASQTCIASNLQKRCYARPEELQVLCWDNWLCWPIYPSQPSSTCGTHDSRCRKIEKLHRADGKVLFLKAVQCVQLVSTKVFAPCSSPPEKRKMDQPKIFSNLDKKRAVEASVKEALTSPTGLVLKKSKG